MRAFKALVIREHYYSSELSPPATFLFDNYANAAMIVGAICPANKKWF